METTSIWRVGGWLGKVDIYVENPDKTEDKMLVSPSGCSYQTAGIEFDRLLAHPIQTGSNPAHHLCRSFEPGEATPQQPPAVGKPLSAAALPGTFS